MTSALLASRGCCLHLLVCLKRRNVQRSARAHTFSFVKAPTLERERERERESAHTEKISMDPVYISHGSPMLPLEDIPARDFLRQWREYLPEKPKAIVAVSAHWNTSHPSVTVTAQNTTIHDFYGFPPELYKLQYNAPGAPELARQVKGLLQAAGFNPVQEDAKWGLDHGAWVPLYLMYPDMDIPVCQLSVQPHKGGLHHYKVGKALSSLREEGVLILASGSATHNLRYISSSKTVPTWALAFDDWLNDALVNGRFEEVIEFEQYAPNAKKVHPSPEHFYPLLVALGAAGDDAKATRIHESWAHSALSMANFSFKAASIVDCSTFTNEALHKIPL